MKIALKIFVFFILSSTLYGDDRSDKKEFVSDYTFKLTNQINDVLHDLAEIPLGFEQQESLVQMFFLEKNGNGTRIILRSTGELEHVLLKKESEKWTGSLDISVKLTKEKTDKYFDDVNSANLFQPPTIQEVLILNEDYFLLALVSTKKGFGAKMLGYYRPHSILSHTDVTKTRVLFTDLCTDLYSEIPDQFKTDSMKILFGDLEKDRRNIGK